MIDNEEVIEAESFDGPIIPIKVRIANPGKKMGVKKKSTARIYDIPNPNRRPGADQALKAKESRIARFRNKPGFPDYRRTNTPDGMTKKEAQKQWEEARQTARRIMEKLKEKGLMPVTPMPTEIVEGADIQNLKTDEQRAEAAMLAALEVMYSPMSQETKLKAATLLLNFCKPKPSSKQEVTVKTASEWFASLEDDSDDE